MRHLEALNLPNDPQPTSTPAVMGQLRFEQPFPQHQVVGLENPAEWLKKRADCFLSDSHYRQQFLRIC